MPQGGESGQPRETGQQTETPDQQWQGGRQGQSAVPGQSGTAGQGGIPNQAAPPDQQRAGEAWGQQQYGAPPPPPPGGMPGQWGAGPMQGMPISPVNEIETRVTGRRVVQYIIDYAITGIVASVIFWALDRGSGALNVGLLLVGVVLVLAWYFWYWVYRPYQANGQSLAMQWFGIHVISKDGRRASMMQLLVRAVLLIVDTLIWGLVGWITIIASRYRQRVGDHAAKTLVVRTRVEPMPARPEYVGAGQAGSM